MESTSNNLQASLKRAQEEGENGENFYLVGLITSVTHDENPKHTLKEIHDAVIVTDAFSLLDPLNLFPLLIRSKSEGAAELLSLIAKEGSPRESLIAIQEALERLSRASEEDEKDEPHFVQLIRLLDICTECIPRLQLRRKGPVQTIKPVVKILNVAIDTIAPHSTKQETQKILLSVCKLINDVHPWVSCNLGADDKREQHEDLFLHMLDNAVGACANQIEGRLAEYRLHQFKFSARFASPSSNDNLVSEGLQAALAAARDLNITPRKLLDSPLSIGKLILLAYQETSSIPTDLKYLESLFPIFASSLKQNAATDSTLALLFTFLHANSQLPQEIVDPLATLLTPFSSNHMDPKVRYIAFRVLAELLSRAPPPVQLAHLSSLLTDCPFEQMRVAAVGLVKDAFLKAITSNDKNSPFSTNALVRALGPTLFRPNPPDFFSSLTETTLKKFLQSSEPSRLTECLSFYYVLLIRDKKNSTGIWDRDMLTTVDNNLLNPLREALKAWMTDDPPIEDPHVMMALASLETCLERVDEALASIPSASTQ